MASWKLGVVALLGMTALNVPASAVHVQAPSEAAPLQPCPSAGTYTADVDGAPGNGLCRQPIDRMAPVPFNIPAGTLFDGLKAFLEQSGARGWVPLDLMVSGTSTSGVSGNLPPREALDRLLSNTGVSYVQDQTGTFRFPTAKDAPVPGGRCIWDKEPPNACPGS